MSNSLNIVIIDDEKKDRENMRLLLESYCPQVNIIGEAKDKNSIIDLLTRESPDLVFMDIQLGTLSIFDVLKELKTINFKIVFVTAYDSYAIKSYEYDAIDYLLKPVDPKRLIKVVNKMIDLKDSLTSKVNILDNLKTIYNKSLEPAQISITDSRGIHVIKTDNLLYCQGDGNYTTFNMQDNSKIVVSKNLKHFEIKMKNYHFLRIHKSYLVNLNHIDFLVKEQGGYVLMKNGTSIPISRNYKKELFRRMNII